MADTFSLSSLLSALPNVELDGTHAEKILNYLKETKDTKEILAILQTLGDLARDSNNRATLTKVESTVPIVADLFKTSSDIEILKLAARVIGNLCYENWQNRSGFFEQGDILEKLVTLLKDKNEDEILQRNVAGAIANLSSDHEKIQNALAKLNVTKLLVDLLKSENEVVQMMSSRAICNLIDIDENQKELHEAGGLSIYLHFLQDPDIDEQLRSDALNVLYSLVYSESIRQEFVSRKIAPIICSIALDENEDASDETIETAFDILNVLSDKDDTKSIFVKENLFQRLIGMIHNKKHPDQKRDQIIMKGVMRIYANLTTMDKMIDEFFKYIDTALSVQPSNDIEIIISSLLVIGNLARDDDKCKRIAKSANVIHNLLELANHKDLRIQHLALGALRNITISVDNKEPIVSAGLIPNLISHLTHAEQPNAHIQFDVVGVFRSLIGNGEQFIDVIVKENGLEPLIKLSRGELTPQEEQEDENGQQKEKDKRIEYESARLLVRFADRSNEYKEVIATKGGIGPILQLIHSTFEILQLEGLKSLASFANMGIYKNQLIESGVLSFLSGFKSSSSDAQNYCNQIITKLSE